MMISPIHSTSDTDAEHCIGLPEDYQSWTIEDKINIFFAQVDGWHLEIADRIINGWRGPSGEDYIQGICPPQTLNAGTPVNHIPDSGYAALQIMINYFETIRFFKTADTQENSRDRFAAGINDVFPERKNWCVHSGLALADILYKDLRSGLYHAIALKPTGVQVVLAHQDDTSVFTFHPPDSLVVDPHNLVRKLRSHLRQFADDLKNPEKSELRRNFEIAFDRRLLGTDGS